jgi:regulator of ribonuclease activity B
MPTEAQYAIQRQADLETISQLLDAGSIPTREHRLEHHFYAEAFDALELLAAKADGLGYEIGEPEQGEDEDGQPFFCCDIIGYAPLDAATIHLESATMLRLAEENGVEYDGWGTYVEDESN